MAKLSSIEKNKRRMRISQRDSAKRLALKEIIMNKTLPLEERFKAQLTMSTLPRDGAKIRIRNRCELTGRPRGFYRKFKISRISLRQLAGAGYLPGVVKASW
jgi:small subunit ribosomal protein S14